MDETPTETRRDNLFAISLVVALAAMLVAIVGVGFAVRAVDEADGVEAGAGGASSVSVSLTEFALDPSPITVAAGGVLTITNDGTVPHNFGIDGTDILTDDLGAGETATLNLASLEPGAYTAYCTIAGHRDAGMEAPLDITESGEGAAGDVAGGSSGHHMTADEMDRMMNEVTTSFPAETEGKGAQVLAPEVLADGTKRFELTAEVVDWEVEPGKVVQAWTYNGTVPGPTLLADIGDQLEIVLNNELPESTAIHFHGLRTPNSMDGVPDITQPPVKPGASFTYAFEARGPAVGMYHSHHNAHEQVPNGLAGSILIGELPTPTGIEPVLTHPMMLNDAGVIGYSLNGKSFPATEPVAVKLGDWFLVHYLNEGVQAHPMHLHGMPQLVIAKDGIPLAQPYEADTINVAPGERYSVLVHADEPGVWVWHCHILPHAETSEGMFGMVTALIVE
jgi:FtsP/CotA-like multicopper oxidase with cupredoxin domain